MEVDFTHAFDQLHLDLIVKNHKDMSAPSMQVLYEVLEADGDWLEATEKTIIIMYMGPEEDLVLRRRARGVERRVDRGALASA